MRAAIELTIDGEDYRVPLDFEFDDLAPEEILMAQALADLEDFKSVTAGLIFVKAARVAPLRNEHFSDFAQVISRLLDADESVITLADLSDG